ncbi:UNVERIFIED_CONTAM: hypothetical protein GTU68_065677, partial [Idotea baltica]|nr:hypothetical protein [Idotea baltica]
VLFNSIEFAFFLLAVFLIYWFLTKGKLKVQNTLLLAASFLFYGWWDYRFLSLIIFSSTLDYSIGLALGRKKTPSTRKLLLWASLLVNLGFLGVFKYYDFFVESFAEAFTFFGTPMDPGRLNIILPVGISFYTFQTLSYTIDVYRGKLQPSRDPIAFFAFVSFFPQLVAGPIERATNLLPQFHRKRSFDQEKAIDGLRQVLWGLFKKIVIADNCATYANQIFDDPTQYNSSTLVLGGIFFAFQIYGDFSGYSDIAIGTARLFGFDLKRNFAFPYFSRDIAEFWRRWHISLSTWFRDYLYIPLGGSRGSTASKIRNVFIIFVVSGFWHGANWTFLAWGLWNRNRTHTDNVAQGRLFPSLKEAGQILATFIITVFAWVFFRADSMGEAFVYLGGIFDPSLFSIPDIFPLHLIFALLILLVVEWMQREKQHGLELDRGKMPTYLRWGIYYGVVIAIALLGTGQQTFIYFQF